MQHNLRYAAQLMLILLLIIGIFFLLNVLSSSTQRVHLSSLKSSLLLKSGVPFDVSNTGLLVARPTYFWGQIECDDLISNEHDNILENEHNTPAPVNSNQEKLHAARLIEEPCSQVTDVWYDWRINVSFANMQIPRIARERHVSQEELCDLVKRYTEGSLFGILGQPKVNVLDLNRALDRMVAYR
jgi:K+-transporting ATPase ATPase C chain